MRKKTLLFFVLLLSLAMIMAACGGGTQSSGGQETPAPEPTTNQQEPAAEVPASEEKKELVMGTGSTGGTYYPLGMEMANVWSNNIANVNVTAVASGASVENLAKISQGEFDLGMTVHIPALEALSGTGDFEGNKVENFSFIGHIYPEVMQIVVRESSGINSIADLKGKRVNIGPAGSGTQATAKIILEAYGIKDGDYTVFEEGFGNGKDRLQDETLDATFGLLGLPAGNINELYAATKDAKILEVTGDELKYVEEKSGYVGYTIPAGSYEFQDQDVQTVSAFAVLAANNDTIDEETAYQLAKVMVEHADQNTHDQAKHMTKENALNGSAGLPIHPGALKYYQEIGLK